MSGYGNRQGVEDYRWTDLPSLVDGDNPHLLVQLMLDGAVARVAQAIGAMEANEVALKCALISKALDLVEGLRVCLDLERGGEIAGNLAALYEYIARRLVTANATNDVDIIREVVSLLRELQAGWKEMGALLASSESTGKAAAKIAV